MGPHQALNWYFYGFPIESSNPRFKMEADGLNAVLHVNEVSTATFGRYGLKIEGTDISDDIVFIEGGMEIAIDVLFSSE